MEREDKIPESCRKGMKNSKERVNLHSQLYNLHSEYGGVAQLGEHLPCKQGVRSSILLISTRAVRTVQMGEGANEKTSGREMGL